MTIIGTQAYGNLATLKETRDFNGDGISDILYATRDWNGNWHVQFTDGATNQVRVGNVNFSSVTGGISGTFHIDINGDGIRDQYSFNYQAGARLGPNSFSYTNTNPNITYGTVQVNPPTTFPPCLYPPYWYYPPYTMPPMHGGCCPPPPCYYPPSQGCFNWNSGGNWNCGNQTSSWWNPAWTAG